MAKKTTTAKKSIESKIVDEGIGKILSERYDITAVQPVDMFPHTVHVENVVALALRGR